MPSSVPSLGLSDFSGASTIASRIWIGPIVISGWPLTSTEVSRASRCPANIVPLVEPRSRTRIRRSRTSTAAWNWEMYGRSM
ncbi:hypothetical protein BE04_17820 [Sorangium cellulosum]|uniref:Uncharacterized protein n=1 Tax=Sorangium cellulosum TaxID=56 RepID=A0A150P3L6_SORCE|nr:hypothetical protein BE04_17820 [Sorangium cellulosum]